jgi:hypothetical protein
MDLWKTLTSTIPLEDGRDAGARIAVRFVFCTFPYFAIALVLNALGNDRFLTTWMAPFFLAIPLVGGVIDWYRLGRRTKAASPTESKT